MKKNQVQGATNSEKPTENQAPPKEVQENVEQNKEEVEEVVSQSVVEEKEVQNEVVEVPKNAGGEEKVDEVNNGIDVKKETEEESGDEDDSLDATSEEFNTDTDEEEDKEPTEPAEIKIGQIPYSIENNRVIRVSKLSKKCKPKDIADVFSRYGTIEIMHVVKSQGGIAASIAYKTKKSATAAVADNKLVTVLKSVAWIMLRQDRKKEYKRTLAQRKREVFVKFLSAGTTEEQLKEHFESCGEIEDIVYHMKHSRCAYIYFKLEASVEKALKLHNSILNKCNIAVVTNDGVFTKWANRYDDKCTLKLLNGNKFKSIEASTLESIFSKFGEIELLDVVCSPFTLALVKYKTEEAAQEAIKELNNKTVEDIILELEIHNPLWKTIIYVTNLPKHCTEEDLINLFSEAGEINSIKFVKRGAKIQFKDTDGYCKSFLYTESIIKGKMIFVEPFSRTKPKIIQQQNLKRPGYRRVASIFVHKKSKNE